MWSRKSSLQCGLCPISPSGGSHSPLKLLGVLAAHILLYELLLSKGQPFWHSCPMREFKGQAPLSPYGIHSKSYPNSRAPVVLAEGPVAIYGKPILLPSPAFLRPLGALKDIYHRLLLVNLYLTLFPQETDLRYPSTLRRKGGRPELRFGGVCKQSLRSGSPKVTCV